MSRYWIICIDGSWNAPGQTDKDPIDNQEAMTKTNVQLVWEALAGKSLDANSPYGSIAELQHQSGEIIYLNGVGSSGSDLLKRFDGTTGAGTSERIVDAYRYLAQRWQLGDAVYGFGFSRGAFALRSLIGLIDFVGLPQHRRFLSDVEVMDLFQAYQHKTQSSLFLSMQKVTIDFIGVWETVDSITFADSVNHFHQVNPSNIEHFRQALALDEQRKEFLPIYFDAKSLSSSKECWFIGAHSNVGGGYVDNNLSNITLFWMLHQAIALGLMLDLSKVPGRQTQSPEGEIRKSYTEFWNAMPEIGKWVEKFHWEIANRKIRDGQLVHASVLQALKQGYQPDAKIPAGESLISFPVEDWNDN